MDQQETGKHKPIFNFGLIVYANARQFNFLTMGNYQENRMIGLVCNHLSRFF
jgi:hypothetical protein